MTDTPPAIYHDGIPANLTAAAADALEWLRWVQAPRRSAENERRLAEAIRLLTEFLPEAEPVFVESAGALGGDGLIVADLAAKVPSDNVD